ncbi:unnamed protein product [Diplocarpon coronariae]|uniref:Uncharacterized protein n=1 Tax=Diplocarpon coronariae TaxID=2795749 RepID=A0A218YYV8_9HELO|nr:hypothetical protein B2J93_5400 [Marssonina coronariae]
MDTRSPTIRAACNSSTTSVADTVSRQAHEVDPMLMSAAPLEANYIDRPSLQSSKEGSQRSIYKACASDSLFNWKWELLSLFGTASALVAIIIVLVHYNGKPSPSWPYEITLNTLVSVFSTLLKALMMLTVAECISQLKWIWFKNPRSLADLTTFENASRGPWGSVNLLFAVKFHHLAALGALVTIVTIAVDPFVQQTIRFYSCSYVDVQSRASIPIARSYTPQQNMLSPMEAGMVGAIYQGLTQPTFNGSFGSSSCPTGNCTFPVKYTTFGVCNSCTNVVYDIQNDFQNHTFVKPKTTIFAADNATASPDGNTYYPRMILNSTFPGQRGPYSYSWPAISLFQPPFDPTVQRPLAASITRTSQTINWTLFPNSSPYEKKGYQIAGFNMISYTRGSGCTTGWMTGGPHHPETDCLDPALLPGAKTAFSTCQASPMDPRMCLGLEDLNHIIASSCMLTYCGKTYEGSVVNGNFTETAVSEANTTEIAGQPGYSIRDNKPAVNSTWPTFMISPCWYNNTKYENVYEYLGFNMTEAQYGWAGYGKYSSVSLEAVIAAGDGPLNYTYMNATSARDPHKKAVFDSCVVPSTPLAVQNLQSFAYGLLDGTVTGQNLAQGGSNGIQNPGKMWASMMNNYSAVWLDPFYNQGAPSPSNTKALMDRLADSTTNYMRTADPNSSMAQGEVNGVQTCVRVVWPWLALPAVLVLATCLLLLATIFKTATQAKTNIWKSSPLAYLYCGLTDASRADVRGSLVTVDEMDQVAKRKDLLLTETSEGWRFFAEDRGHLQTKARG